MLAISFENRSKQFRLGTLSREVFLEKLRANRRRLALDAPKVAADQPALGMKLSAVSKK
jgi:hypothetical protein